MYDVEIDTKQICRVCKEPITKDRPSEWGRESHDGITFYGVHKGACADREKAEREAAHAAYKAKEKECEARGLQYFALTAMEREMGGSNLDVNDPASLLVLEQADVTDRLREQRRLTELMDAQRRHLDKIVKLNPEERQEYFKVFGVPVPLLALDELDKQFLAKYAESDLDVRKSALNKYTVTHRRLRQGAGPRAAVRSADTNSSQDWQRRQNRKAVDYMTETARAELQAKVEAALEATGGNKTHAARLLGISRDKVQRLTGVAHRGGEVR